MKSMKKKGYAAGGLKAPSASQSGLKKLPTAVRNNMGYMNKGGMPMKKKGYAKGGMNDMRKTGMFYGGMAKKMGYAKGAMMCGASNPAARPMKKGK